VVRRGDMPYLNYLLSKGADANLRDRRGESGILLAARLGRLEMIQVLAKAGGNINLANASGETALIVAVQRRDT
ncbi:ankyrin repeat domain-containing protein, partial [Salmonella enterica]